MLVEAFAVDTFIGAVVTLAVDTMATDTLLTGAVDTHLTGARYTSHLSSRYTSHVVVDTRRTRALDTLVIRTALTLSAVTKASSASKSCCMRLLLGGG